MTENIVVLGIVLAVLVPLWVIDHRRMDAALRRLAGQQYAVPARPADLSPAGLDRLLAETYGRPAPRPRHHVAPPPGGQVEPDRAVYPTAAPTSCGFGGAPAGSMPPCP